MEESKPNGKVNGHDAPPPRFDSEEIRILESTSMLLDRLRIANLAGMTFNGLRDEYEIFGYDRMITNAMYRDEYDRGGIAGRVVDVFPNATWRGSPAFEIIEDEDPNKTTPFEQAWIDLDTRLQIQGRLHRVDKLAGLSTYAVLLLGAGGELSSPLPKVNDNPKGLLYLQPYSGGGGPAGTNSNRNIATDASVTILELEDDPRNERFGLPRTYQLQRTGFTDGLRPIHWTRIIHIAEGCLEDDIYGQPTLERIWNLLIDLRKVTGGGAEAFFLRANQGLHLDVDKEMKMEEPEKEALRAQAEEYQHQLRRMLRTRGVKVEPLGSDVANFQGPADTVLTQIAGAKAIPKRILMGSEMGELASSQDRDNWKDQIVGRQTQYAGPMIVRPLVDRLIEYGYLPTPKKGEREYQVVWPHIQTLTEAEKATGAQQWASTNSTMGQPVFTTAEIRDKWYAMAPLDEEQLEEEIAIKKVMQEAALEAQVASQEAMMQVQNENAPAADEEDDEEFARAAEQHEVEEILADALKVQNFAVVREILKSVSASR